MTVQAASLLDDLKKELFLKVKEAAEISRGTEISEMDTLNINYLCKQVLLIQDYLAQLYVYLKNRVGKELVGARLISHVTSGRC